MAWNPPSTVTEGQLITPSFWTEQIYDNMLALKTPPQSRVSAGATTNTNSTSFVDIALVTRTVVLGAGSAVDVMFTGAATVNAAAAVLITLLIDGANVGDATTGITGFSVAINQGGNLSFTFRTDVLSAGSRIFKCQWKTSAGTVTLNNGWSFAVVER